MSRATETPLLRPRSVLALLGLVSLSLAFIGCKSEEENNQKCEADCAASYAEEVEGCSREATECLAKCAGPDDYDCTWDCEDLEFECQAEYIQCTAVCPCARDVSSCATDCEQGDIDCYTDCTNDYTECAGADSPYMCGVACGGTSSGCNYGCESFAYSSEDFSSCRDDCASESSDCLSACD